MNKSTKALTIVVFILLFFGPLLLCEAQIVIQNPSFEDLPSRCCAAANPWQVCSGSPDIQPGSTSCVSLSPFDGNTYQGLVASPFIYGVESIGQLLSTPLTNGKKYSFSIYLSKKDYPTICGASLPIEVNFEVWGHNIPCIRYKKLFEVTSIDHIGWRQYTITFISDNNYPFVEFLSNARDPSNNKLGYLLIDNMSPQITEFPWNISFTSPSQNSHQSCSFNVTGKLDQPPGSTLSLYSTLLKQYITCSYNGTDTSWSAVMNYPKGTSGKDSLIATANFNTKPSEFSSDTIVITVSPNPFLLAQVSCEDSSVVFAYKDSQVENDSTVTVFWDLGDGTSFTASGKDPSFRHSYNSKGNYVAYVKTLSANGCTDSLSRPISISKCSGQVPILSNLVTANGDGKNDFFEILDLSSHHKLEIYNRWGERVYETSQYKNDWQGNDGVYYYLLTNDDKLYKGWVQVVR